MARKQRGRTGAAAVLRRTGAIFLAGTALWTLWMTADLSAAGAALWGLGENVGLAVGLLAAELGQAPADGPLAGMTGWERMVLGQSALLRASAAAQPAPPEEDPAEPASPAPSAPAPDPEDSAEVRTTSAPSDIVEQTLVGSNSEAYVSADGVYLRNYAGCEVDLTTLEVPELTLSAGDEPQILIIHTHTTEAYAMDGTDIYAENGTARTTDNYYNTVRVGEEMAAVFREAGFGVVHDTELYDYPAYNGAYTRSGAAIQKWLEKYPDIQVVLDVHRDALIANDGTVYKTAAVVDGEKVAQCMLVVGTDAGGQKHDNWRQNLALAVELQHRLNADAPTFARPIVLRSSRFNQQLTPGSLLVEVGSHGNTLQEALAAARLFARSAAEVLDTMRET